MSIILKFKKKASEIQRQNVQNKLIELGLDAKKLFPHINDENDVMFDIYTIEASNVQKRSILPQLEVLPGVEYVQVPPQRRINPIV